MVTLGWAEMILETPIDPLAFDNMFQIFALLIIVVGGIAFKWLGDKTKQGNEDVAKVLSTLTTNNSGSHIKDQLDRLESGMKASTTALEEHIKWAMTVDERVTELEDVIRLYSPDELEQEE
jgi:flagellar motor component MotA